MIERIGVKSEPGSAECATTCSGGGWYFPPPGEGLEAQHQRPPQKVGLAPGIVEQLQGHADHWALWRHGYLVHAEGDWKKSQDVFSLRKTWHAMTVGAAIQQGKIPGYDQRINVWETDLTGKNAAATWWHVITQSSGFDYPHPDYPEIGDPEPGEVWTYSDKNPLHLCNALAKVYGKRGYEDDYDEVIKTAYFDAIGMRGWGTRAIEDGIRFVLNLEHMGRLGLLACARGRWNGRQIVPKWFVEELETKQTRGMKPVYNGPDDGNVGQGWWHEHREQFPECPYGYMTWTNSAGQCYPGADPGWAFGSGIGGYRVYWNHELGIVYAGIGIKEHPTDHGIPHILEAQITGPNPLFTPEGSVPVGQWQRFEAAVLNPTPYDNPYRDVTLRVTYTAPDGETIPFWGFYDGGRTWRIRFMPDRLGTWRYRAEFSDGSKAINGSFECVESDVPGLIGTDPSNPMWFGYRGGKHELIRGLHVGDRFFAANWPREKRTAFLDWAGEQDYNLLSIASHYLNRGLPDRGGSWQTPALWPLDAAEYRRLETLLDDLAERRMLVFPFAGFFGKDSNYPRDPEDQELYLRYTIARLGPYWNMLFNTTGPEPNLDTHWMAVEDVVRLGKLIARLDPFGHAISVHNRPGDDPYRDSDWTTYGVLQGPKTIDRVELAQGLLGSHHPDKPLLAQETLWSGNKLHPDYSDDDLRKNAFVINMCAAAIVFADNAGYSSSGFSGSLDLAERRQRRHDILRHVWNFFETVAFYRMSPHPEIVDRGFCLADPGREYLIYLQSPGDVNVSVQDGPYQVVWINGKNNEDRRPGDPTPSGRGLQSPDDGEDWLLHLGRKGGRKGEGGKGSGVNATNLSGNFLIHKGLA